MNIVGEYGYSPELYRPRREIPPAKSCRSRKRSSATLDDYVIGQERAKIVLAVAVYNHYKRILHSGEERC